MKYSFTATFQWVSAILIFFFFSLLLHAQERLTVDEAVRLALAHNRAIQIAASEVRRVHQHLLAARTQRWPQVNLLANGGQLLTKPGLSFPAGSLGSLSDGTLLPSESTTVRAARRPAAFVFGQINQPLTQQYRIHLELKSLLTEQAITNEKRRLSEQDVVSQVRRTFYQIVQAQSALANAEENVRFYQELNHVLDERLLQKAALKAEALAVQAQLAQAQYRTTVPRDQLQDASEQLNRLLGQPIDTPVQIVDIDDSLPDLPELVPARIAATKNRPELREAALQINRAELNRRIKLAEYIPDVSLNVSYLSFINVNSTLVGNIASVGLQVQWEPFDWGRKRHEAAEIREGKTQSQLRQRDTEASVEAQVSSAWRKAREARQFLEVTQLSQNSSKETMRVTKVQFEQQSALLRDVLNAAAAEANAEDGTRRAAAQFWSARADLLKAMGTGE